MRSSVAVAALLVIATSPALGEARDGRAQLKHGIELYREASYAESVAALESARARGGLEPEESVECSFYLGAGYVALGSTAAARRELRRVLDAQPQYELPQYTSPKVAALFRDVREELEKQPRLHPLPPERRARSDGGGLLVRFEASRTGGRAFGVVDYRWRGESFFREAPLVGNGDVYGATLPDGKSWRTGTLEYFAVGQAPAGAIAAGSAERPLELPVTAQLAASLRGDSDLAPAAASPRQSKARRLWWLWTTIGAVAATGVGVGLYYGLRPTTSSTDATLNFQVH